MLDIKRLRSDLEGVSKSLQRRGFVLDSARFNALEAERRTCQEQTQALQTERNAASKAIGRAKAAGESIQPLLDQVAGLGDQLKANEQTLAQLQQDIQEFMLAIPNTLADDVPAGETEADNKEIRRWGEPRQFDFTPKDHVALGEHSGQLDFTRAAKLSGARFSVLHGDLARMQRVLANWMMNLHVDEHGYQEAYVPYLVSPDCLYGTGQLPKFAEDFFTVAGERELVLIPTAEVPLANLHRDEIVAESDLPLKHVAHTPCFRSEAGSYGKDTRGMIRQHQFDKVELVQVTTPAASPAAQEAILQHAERILQLLALPYRVVLLCSGDTGFSATRTFDIEVWLPGQNAYREISSISDCGDFQARRLQLRHRDPETSKPALCHTLNGSGLALGRTLVAIMENYQQADGRMAIPAVLQPFFNNQTVLG